jgi:hypothetical protein
LYKVIRLPYGTFQKFVLMYMNFHKAKVYCEQNMYSHELCPSYSDYQVRAEATVTTPHNTITTGTSKSKDKGKAHPRKGHEGPEWVEI